MSDADINNARDIILNKKEGDKEKAKRQIEWYKYIQDDDSKTYSTALDDLSLRATFNDNIYNADGTIENSENDAKSMKSFTPVTSISIENDREDSTDINTANVDSSHKNMYSRFNLGIIKVPETVIKTEKKITNVDFTTQNGTTVVSENPYKASSILLTDLERLTLSSSDIRGSRNSKLEIDPTIIEGGRLEVTYTVRITNESEADYVEDDETGTYFWYGQFNNNTRPKTVEVTEVQDLIDEKYKFNEAQEVVSSKNSQMAIALKKQDTDILDETETVTQDAIAKQYLIITGWSKLSKGQEETIIYKAYADIESSDEDTLFNNDVQIKKVKLDKLTSLQTKFIWEEDKSVFTIIPNLGGNRSNTYWVAGTVALIVLAAGIVIIRKRVVK